MDSNPLMPYMAPYESAIFSYYRRDDGIQVYEVSDIRRDVVDRWVMIVTQHDLAAVQRGDPALSLYIVKDAWPTPYMASQMAKSSREPPKEIAQRMAVVVADSFLANIFSMFIRSMPTWALQDLRFFKTQDEPLVWLHAEKENIGRLQQAIGSR